MYKKVQLKALYNFISMIILFVTFFTNYMIFGANIVESFMRAGINMIVTNVILRIITFLWTLAFSSEEWRFIIEGPRPVELEDEKKNESFN